MLEFGTYPTPVERIEPLSTRSTSLWVKRDDLTSPLYGGSKLRKLEPLLAEALARRATTVVTLGAVGSHHVLATGVFGKIAGLRVEGILLGRPESAHVLEVLRASIAQGIRLAPAASYRSAAAELAARARAGAYVIPAGGTNLLSSAGVVAAALELGQQIRSGLLAEPDLIVLALGSGGTAAGLAAGVVEAGLHSRVLAIAVAQPLELFAQSARRLAQQLVAPSLRPEVLRRLEIDSSYLGDGYGRPSSAGAEAEERASRVGLVLDDTYTSKAFAAALDRVAEGRVSHVLFWQTLSSAGLAPLLIGAPSASEIDPELRRLAQAAR